MLNTITKKWIASYVLDCSVADAELQQPDANQKQKIELLEQGIEDCLKKILPELREKGTFLLEEHRYPLFQSLPAYTGMRFLNQEIGARGIDLDKKSFQPNLQLVFQGVSGFLLRVQKKHPS